MYKVSDRALTGLLIGGTFGVIGGFLGGLLGQTIFGSFSAHYRMSGLPELLLRGVGWSVIGLFIGISQAISVTSPQKMKNGIIGGSLGGFLGGIAFQLIKYVSPSGLASSFAALVIVGLLTGLFLGLVESISKEAWLRVIKGYLKGKEFIIYEENTSIGSSPKSQIVLMKDNAVSPVHAKIHSQEGGFILSDEQSMTGTFVNDISVRRRLLSNMDRIRVGSTEFEFHEVPKRGENVKRKESL